MSAIAGIYHLNNQPVPIEHVHEMMGKLDKYPANDVSTFIDHNLFLGCHAQWITPESVGEKLPFIDNKRNTVITSDAIIDNREELFEMLQIDKQKRSGITDSELILHAYYKWGETSPKYLIGDFAYVIWDRQKKILFGARDFSGSRPLYYSFNQPNFCFCTTIEPLLTLPYIQKEWNKNWIGEFLALESVIDTVDCSLTPYSMIQQLPPAHSITIKNGHFSIIKYCNIIPEKQLKLNSDEEYIEAFQEVFQKAVSARLRTFRHVGAHLSGGLDSGTVVSFAAKALHHENKQLSTFSYVPPSDFQDYTPMQLLPDERPFIKETVNHIGNLNDHYLDFKGRNSYTDIDDYLEILETPYKYFENSFWIKGMFERASEEGIGVLLNGGRGNFTISWGHAMYYYAELMKKLKFIKLMKELNFYSRKVGGARFRRLPAIAKMAYPVLDSNKEANHFPSIINKEFESKMNIYNKFKEKGVDTTGWFGSVNIYEQRKRHFECLFHWSATNNLAAKLSLKYGVWKRDSTNDLRVVKFCLSLPEDQFVSNGMDRALIRRATEHYLPDKVRLNQRVRGVQGADWLHRMLPYWNNFIEEIEALAQDKHVLNFLDVNVIKSAIHSVKGGVSSQNATDPQLKILMRALIFSRYLKKVF